jgi:hypothetical protein
VDIPEPLARLVRQLPERRRGGSSAHLSDPHQWLFPGERAGHSMGRSHLGKRLAAVGVDVRGARNGPLLQVAGDVPPVVLADHTSQNGTSCFFWKGRLARSSSENAVRAVDLLRHADTGSRVSASEPTCSCGVGGRFGRSCPSAYVLAGNWG